MRRIGMLLTLLLGLGLLAGPVGAQVEEEGWFNQGWIGESEGVIEDDGLYESEYGYGTDEYGYYERGYDWDTDDGEYENWYGESDEWW